MAGRFGFAFGGVLLAGIVAGILLWGGFHTAMEYSNRTEFCISCHEMRDFVYEEYKETAHYSNASGVQTQCADCHVPEAWGPKIVDKIKATRELYGWATGKIDTAEKFEAHRLVLAERVWDYMQATDSRECRSCHSDQAMDFHAQDPEAAEQMQAGFAKGETCIDCHKGIAHKMPDLAKRAREQAVAFMEGTEALESDTVWTKRTTPLHTAAAPDADKLGTVLPGVKMSRLERDGDFVKVRVSGWQAGEVARGQYAMFGHRILNVSISGSAVDQVEKGETRFYSDGNQDWVETALEGWITAADLTADQDALWAIANATYVSQCGVCHSAAAPSSRGALAWQADVQAYQPRTSLTAEEGRLVLRYLQLHSSDIAGQTN
ncbi:NapC/NirT family cytochrome c [Aliiruegeria lutimaris]|uniref:Cytochrome c-type protein n=1 Tax=Aliiruegeria lutimaris TaxID=571298 RepID=A0A1G9N9J3_9RHOB|nr:NapC/NirT family cytochrome c [Aliiruegeria lutimaris]SDL82807.1 trimethylamine-N-oxide reductase (cytochrome c), cytochrome c-type subunit TorC [Aliiruegeria lutimaris]